MKRAALVTVASSLIFAVLACNPLSSLTSSSGTNNTVTELWSDVPRMDGLTLSDLEVPPYIHLLLGIVTKQLLGEGKDSGDWIDFTTDKTPDDVKAYYTPELMEENGWEHTDKSTCVAGSNYGFTQVGQACFFIKHVEDKQVGLMIIASVDDSTKKTNVFFVRVTTVEGTPTPNP